MSIWQNISNTASAVGGPLLSVLQKLTGQKLERDNEASVAFTIGMIALGAKMAKADGTVSEAEISAFRQVFEVQPDELANVARVFNLAKQDVAGYEAYANQVASLFAERPQVLEDVMDGLFHIAKADGVVREAELDYLHSVAGIFGLTERFRCIRARHIHAPEDDPYVVLGVDPCVNDQVLKSLYRQIVKENHPDLHVAAGMPSEAIEIANQRLAAINQAWSEISAERGF